MSGYFKTEHTEITIAQDVTCLPKCTPGAANQGCRLGAVHAIIRLHDLADPDNGYHICQQLRLYPNYDLPVVRAQFAAELAWVAGLPGVREDERKALLGIRKDEEAIHGPPPASPCACG